jgi:2-octaprenyl-6-methoxyphenol hydroxylase
MPREAQAIAVVGNGPVGIAAAILLDRVGFAVTLVGPDEPRHDHRTSALLGSSVDFLDHIGVWDEVAAAGAPLRTLRIIDATGRLIHAPEVSFDASEIGRDAFGYNIPNAALIRILEEALDKSGVLRRRALLDDLVPGAASVLLKLSEGEDVLARLVVAADGRKSPSREAADIPVRRWTYDQAALVANLAHAQPHHDVSTEFHTPHGPFTLVPLPGRCSSLVWVGRAAEMEARAALSDSDLAAAIETQSGSILGAIAIDGPRQVFPLSGMNAESLAAKRVMLAGEAAHVFPPIGAQGLNLGYRDVAALARILTNPHADPGSAANIAAYRRLRSADMLLRTAGVDMVNRTLLSAFLPTQGLRGLGLFLLDSVPPLRRTLMRQMLSPA